MRNLVILAVQNKNVTHFLLQTIFNKILTQESFSFINVKNFHDPNLELND